MILIYEIMAIMKRSEKNKTFLKDYPNEELGTFFFLSFFFKKVFYMFKL